MAPPPVAGRSTAIIGDPSAGPASAAANPTPPASGAAPTLSPVPKNGRNNFADEGKALSSARKRKAPGQKRGSVRVAKRLMSLIAPMAVKSTGMKIMFSSKPSSPSVMQNDLHISNLLDWVEAVESDENLLELPPFNMILYPDLVRAWGWERLVPYKPSDDSVKWSEYKTYLKMYLKHNARKVAVLCGNKQQPESTEEIVAAELNNFLHAAPNQCREIEMKLLRTCLHDLTSNDFILSKRIQMWTGRIIRSEGGCLAKVAGLMCIMEEAKLMCISRKHNFLIEEIMTTSNKIRRSALNLLLSKGNESDVAAATAAMVGLAVEAEALSDLLIQRAHNTYVMYFTTYTIRHRTATFLTMLEKEFTPVIAGMPL